MSAAVAVDSARPVSTSLISRLHRIEGQVRGIERMVAEDRPCIDVLTQIGAATTALQALGVALLDRHVRACATSALARHEPPATSRGVDEIAAAVHRFARTR